MLNYSFLIQTPDGGQITTAQFRTQGPGWLAPLGEKYMSDF